MSKVILQKQEVISISNIIDKILAESNKIKLNYKLLSILDEFKNEKEKIQNILEKFQKEYDEKRLEICKRHCTKNEDGTEKIKDNKFCGLEDNENFIKEINIMNESFDEKRMELTNILKEDIEFDIDLVSVDLIPDVINGQELDVLRRILE